MVHNAQAQAQAQGYPSLPPPAPAPAVLTTPVVAGADMNIPDLHQKTFRLVEMGFDRENVVRALVHFKGDEQAAAEAILLGTSIPDTHTPAPAVASAPPPLVSPAPVAAAPQSQSQPWSGQDEQQQGGGGGLFGKLWGRGDRK